ncbi:MAG: hypothetical protein QF578_18445 [Alphaproteobacteria bacterium]|jgi:hypothetical protein|nr:hypothetical protein [Alphaproteobacteria bacterium]MDP6566815.1 hypothetical protein [Alphaproteobacteria bacterium]MDP6813924.1 hypothetical protein [Alphaproteobacteria bacterium]
MVEISYPADWRDIPPENWSKMRMTPEAYTAMRDERLRREAAAPAVGDPAPDFHLERLSPEGRRTGQMFRLSEGRGRPIALVFGSYT